MLKRFIITIILIPTALVGIYLIAQFMQPSPEDITDPDIAMQLGEKYSSPTYPLGDYWLSIEYYQKASDLGNKAANAHLAQSHFYHKRDEIGCEEIMRLAESALDTEEIGRAYFIIGDIYYWDYCNRQDFDKAEYYFLLSAENGDKVAPASLAYIYELHKPDSVKEEYWSAIVLRDIDEVYNKFGTYNKIKNYSVEIYEWYRGLLK
ncbi:SEL1-like repeat protein [Curvivirga aplysinae]|uniref:sel1 repeat family protein n=1 Tax=Curvivirga aplysinae TaxID=2529852 RepID=UPI0012BB538E|nr:sel1 repeat family protein [Curvivirga aplysinae]MTI11295.1 sel1 repeat family protein [Curvivirga aplysinae]